ncbi:SPOR domain-containing protein [Carboxylicivirga caseinilyticus]|uniref:HU domain-containing protein n=1 Tax=Carboxylicivirga caseinilyticus TaxID=3417572 RepID=UPI003D358696|nr:SPOR domain-containing protein [Marinilabiliaceae bacterium A049]
MTTIEQHISNLLYTHDCVIIPDFGAFVASLASARIDKDKNILLPPSKEIGFNRSLSHNDSLLISTFAQRNGLTYSHAKIEVERFRSKVIDQLESGNEVNLDKIGSLKLDAIGNVQFTSGTTENYLPEAFGLTSFHFTPEININPVKENIQVKRLLKPLSQRNIAATVTLLIALFAISPSITDSGVDKNYSTAGTLDYLFPVKADNHELVVNAKDFTNSASEDVLIVKESLPVEENHFFLIAGSFKKESQAKQFLKQIQLKGEEQAFVLESPNKRYRVALDGYTNKPEAVNSMKNYRLQENFKTVWVLKQ